MHLLESAYFQMLKRENFADHIKAGSSLFYHPVGEWLEKYFAGEIISHLQYAETIQIYVDQFGLENVYIFLFEELVCDSKCFIERICKTMGIDIQEGIHLMEKKIDNERWTAVQLELLQRINSSRRESLKFKFSGKIGRRKMLNLNQEGVPYAPGEKARAPIPPAWKEKIYSFTEKGNRWLEQFFKLPLSKYGYFG